MVCARVSSSAREKIGTATLIRREKKGERRKIKIATADIFPLRIHVGGGRTSRRRSSAGWCRILRARAITRSIVEEGPPDDLKDEIIIMEKKKKS